MLDYRNEKKYLCSETALTVLEARLKPLMKPDPHQAPGACYHIRSMYFDDYENSCMMENEAGVDARTKFRIRIYPPDVTVIRLELKSKLHGLTRKESCSLNPEQLDRVLRGDTARFLTDRDTPSELRRLVLAMQTRLLAPKVIVDYDRTAYLLQEGNVRVTFDRNIRACTAFDRFLDDWIPGIPVLDTGQQLLEVKYDEFLPGYLTGMFQYGSFRETAFSKYMLCRERSPL